MGCDKVEGRGPQLTRILQKLEAGLVQATARRKERTSPWRSAVAPDLRRCKKGTRKISS